MASANVNNKKRKLGHSAVDRIFGPGPIQPHILKNLSNVFCLKEAQACVSLYALGFLKQEGLKEHLTKHSKQPPLLPPPSENGLSNQMKSTIKYSMKIAAREADTDVSQMDFETEFEQFRAAHKYMEYVPLEVYRVVRSGLCVERHMKKLSETELRHRVNLLEGACKAGFDVEDVQRIVDLLGEMSNVSWADKALRSASKYGHVHLVRYFWETLSNEDLTDKDFDIKDTALVVACTHGHIGILRFFYETIGNMDMNESNSTHQKAFMIACRNGRTDVVKYLYENISNIGIEKRDQKGRTPLMLACASGHLDTVKYLCETVDNVDVDARDDAGQTPFMIACKETRQDIVKYFHTTIGNVDMNDTDDVGHTPFMIACGCTSLSSSAMHTVKYLYETIGNVDLSIRDKWGRTAFMIVCENGQEYILRYFHKKLGIVDVNDTDKNGTTALILASICGNIDIIKYLHKKIGNLDVDASDSDELTALMHACWEGHDNVVEYLIWKAKADLYIEDDRGWNAKTYAIRSGHDEVVKLFRKIPFFS